MTLYTFALICLWSIVALLIIAVLVYVYFLGRFSIKDDNTKAIIFVKTGRHISKPIKARLFGKPINKGSCYVYDSGKIFVPSRYGENYYKGKRILFLSRLGQLIASPFDNDPELSIDEKDELIYEFVSSHIGADAMRALKGKSMGGIMMIAVVAFIIGIIVVVGWNYITTTMNAPTDTTIPVKPIPSPIKITPIEGGK